MSYSQLLTHLTDYKDAYDVLFKMVVLPAGILGFVRYLLELSWTRKLRREELDWRRAQKAHELLTGMAANSRIQDALRMLDYNGATVRLDNGTTSAVTSTQLHEALRTVNTIFDKPSEVYIRDCFDQLLSTYAAFEHGIRRNLIAWDDVRQPTEYYTDIMARARPVYEQFARTYGMADAVAFMSRSECWNKAAAAAPVPAHTARPERAVTPVKLSQQGRDSTATRPPQVASGPTETQAT